MAISIPVIMYHALEDSDHPAGAQGSGEQLYVIQICKFIEQLAYLQQEGYRSVLLEELNGLAVWPEKSVVLTFDDGHESNYILALPLLQQYGFKADFFITTGWINTPHFMTAEQIKALLEAGMGIGSHGVTHSFISEMDDAGMRSELGESKSLLTDLLGQPINAFSAPGGRISARVAQTARLLGYTSLCSSQVGVLNKISLLNLIPRFAIRASTSLSEFAGIVSCDVTITGRMVQRARILSLAKAIFGNRLYEKVRSVFLE